MEIPAPDNATTVFEVRKSSPPLILEWIKQNVVTTVLTAIAIVFVYAFFSVKRYRESVIKQNGALKKIPWNKWFGTFPAMADIFKTTPQDSHPQATMTMLYRKHKLDNVFMTDLWPATVDPFWIIADPAVAAQLTQDISLPKHKNLRRYLEHVTGPQSLILTTGEFWKRTRMIFNPGFALSHLLTMLPTMVDDCIAFRNNLDKIAEAGEVVQLEGFAAKLAFDVIAHIALDHDLNSQLGPNDLVESYLNALKWAPAPDSLNPLSNCSPVTALMKKYYTWKMNRYIGAILEERYKTQVSTGRRQGRHKPAIDLALDEYRRLEDEQGRKRRDGVDATFKTLAVDQMKSFMFAGHDTTATTICFCFHMLARNPDAAEKIRKEHNELLGDDLSKAADVLKANPGLINKFVYTSSVVKETLRLFPAASTVREGRPDVSFTYDGQTYSTNGTMTWIVGHVMHRREDLFPNPDAFIPERFLPLDHPDRFQDVPKDAWRPFEKGPRNCIGQELALMEIKVALALTCREFDVTNAQEEWDRKLGREKPGDQLDGRRGMFGDRVYQALRVSAKPIDEFPAKVTRRVLRSAN